MVRSIASRVILANPILVREEVEAMIGTLASTPGDPIIIKYARRHYEVRTSVMTDPNSRVHISASPHVDFMNTEKQLSNTDGRLRTGSASSVLYTCSFTSPSGLPCSDTAARAD